MNNVTQEEIQNLLVPAFKQFCQNNPFKTIIINFIDSSNPKDTLNTLRISLDSGMKTPKNSEDWIPLLEEIIKALKAPTVEDNELI